MFGFLGGSGATNAKALDSAVRNSSSFIKASSSYSKVLTKIAMGSYKNLAGAAGARFLTVTALQTTWQAIVKNTINTGLVKALLAFIGGNLANTVKVLIQKNFS